MVRRWRSWFLEGQQNVHDDERSGRPVTATDNAPVAAVRNVVEADRRVTIDEIMIRLPPGIEIGRSSIGTIMSDVLNFRKVCARWFPRLLSENHKQQQMEASRAFLEMHRRDGDQLFSRIFTGDESWVHHSTPETKLQSMVWKKPEESAPKKAKDTISAVKVMAIVFWDCKGVLLVEYLPPNTTVNAARYCEVLTKLRAAIKRKPPGLLSRKVLLVHGNTRPHAARKTQTWPNVQRIFFNLPDEKENYEQTKMALDKYFTPHKNVVTERFKFRQRVQKDDESIDNYLISLRELSKSCEFGNLEADMIRDQIIEKCNNKQLKEKLLQQENLTLSKTIDIARMLEISRKEIRLLEPQNDQTLNRVLIKPKKHYNVYNFNKDRPLPCYGYFNAVISWKENSFSEEIYVIDKRVESLLGGKASFELGITKRANHVNESMSTNIETLVQEHEHLFHGLGTIKGYSHKVTLKDNYRPIAQRCRRIPYAMVEAVNQELDKMLENGIIEEVHQGSEWVSNIIVVPKRDSEEIRLCIDLREVNKAILRERHPIPTIDNMLHALKGAKVFAKLDAKKKGFWQVDLDPQSRPLTTFVTHTVVVTDFVKFLLVYQVLQRHTRKEWLQFCLI
ncbi:hypothetical protein LAZ67_16002066 [Cordylochernes scorpioides]|uniref:Reverse transcriptase domain-containing protein n=1 Tax=Cordylochernes scorpioides TaxID=51811 RepID=A0ABY6LBQ8_9ARAC|nr:hypothetical protein LAZ67_16002066 [Cordylochernes scorpioides]